MKKIIFLLLVFISVSFIIYVKYDEKQNNLTNEKTNEVFSNLEKEDRMVFISYIDYSNILKNKTVDEMKESIDKMIENIKNIKFNIIILQIRSFSDAIYKSNIYLSSKTVVEKEGDELPLDILEYFIEVSHKNDIKLYGWINPFRIRTNSNIDDINKNNFYYKWLNTSKIEITNEGIYLNPADSDVRNIIISGIEEVVLNYDIDGILFDDYFYPSKTIDLEDYQLYKKENGTLSIDDYRRDNINKLIIGVNKAIKNIDSNVLFGISPSGNINNNYNEEYLDVSYILENEDYIDFIIPQIYYGFFNESMPFIETLNTWNDLVDDDIKLYVALALYKSGLEDMYAGSGSDEWILNNDIIKKQVIMSRSYNKYRGFAIFRYAHLFNEDDESLKKEVSNLKTLF